MLPSTILLNNNERSAFNHKSVHAIDHAESKNKTESLHNTEFRFDNLPVAPKVNPQPIILPVEVAPVASSIVEPTKDNAEEKIVPLSAHKSLRSELEARMNSDEKFTPDDVLHYLNLMQQRLVQKDSNSNKIDPIHPTPSKIHVHYMDEEEHTHNKSYPKTPHPHLNTPSEKNSKKRLQSEVSDSPEQIKESYNTPAPKSNKMSESDISKGHTASRILDVLNKVSKPVSTPLPTPLSEAKRFRVAPPTFCIYNFLYSSLFYFSVWKFK